MVRALLLVLSVIPLCGWLNSWTSESRAFMDDPAVCKARHPDVCDVPNIADALEKFPYWDYRSNWGNGAGFTLGTASGYLWGVVCQHCRSDGAPWEIVDGPRPWSGRAFRQLGFDGSSSGPYRQFGRGDQVPANSFRDFGDYLYRLAPQNGESLPTIPFVRLLPSKDVLTDGTLMLTLGKGAYSHPSLGWFVECAATAAGGGPPANACCTAPRVPVQYEPPEKGICGPPYRDDKAVCYGGEGDFEKCTQAGLTYLGPVWQARGAWKWGTWIYERVHSRVSKLHGSDVEVIELDPAAKLVEQFGDHCVRRGAPVSGFVPRQPPVARVKTHLYCEKDTETGNVDLAGTHIGDSGAPHFAYVRGEWYYVGSGDNLTGIRFPLHTVQHRDEWERFIWGGALPAPTLLQE